MIIFMPTQFKNRNNYLKKYNWIEILKNDV